MRDGPQLRSIEANYTTSVILSDRKMHKTNARCPHLRPFSYFPFWTLSQITDRFVSRFGRRITAGSFAIAYDYTLFNSFATSG